MPTPLPHRNCWPTREQECLLEAVLQSGPKTVEAWNNWKARAVLKDLDAGSYRLLPLLYSKLLSAGIPSDDLALLKGVYRHSLCRNRVRFGVYEELSRHLQLLGVPFLALKGVALTALYYRDIGTRPMDDLDILIRPSDKESVVEALIASGYRRESSHSILTKAINLVGPQDVIIDIHWALSLDCLGAALSDSCWDTQVCFQYESIHGRTLSPTLHLFHTLTHGLAWNSLPSFRWIVDATLILRESVIDWALLCNLAEENRLSRTLTEGLSYLQQRFGNSIPEDVLYKLRKFPVSRMENWEFRCKTANRFDAPFAWRFLARFWRHSTGLSWPQKVLAFKKILFGYLGIKSWHQISGQLLSRLSQRRQQSAATKARTA